ncbi:DUF177 domain-containing protein [Meiothermus cerbereus]|uniref:DUF177 domain-containing protein n=1 Tax=Meiothermus cerbereus TaxID=65552 RepID=UPI003EE83680
MKHRPLQNINLAQLMREGGSTSARDEIQDYIALHDERIPLQGKALWKATVTRIEGEGGLEFWLSGEIAGNAIMECRRCLTPTPTPVRAHFQYLLRYQLGLQHPEAIEEDEEEILLFGHPDLDLEPILSEAFALELPYTTLCKEDCKGLCPVCGANLNEVDCGHLPQTQTKLAAELSRLLGEIKD